MPNLRQSKGSTLSRTVLDCATRNSSSTTKFTGVYWDRLSQRIEIKGHVPRARATYPTRLPSARRAASTRSDIAGDYFFKKRCSDYESINQDERSKIASPSAGAKQKRNSIFREQIRRTKNS